jgi:hypothetical protein
MDGQMKKVEYVPIPDFDTIVTDIPKQDCPVCGTGISHYTNDDSPSDGDMSLCAHCCAVLVFDENLLVTVASNAIINEMDPESRNKMEYIRQILAEKQLKMRH